MKDQRIKLKLEISKKLQNTSKHSTRAAITNHKEQSRRAMGRARKNLSNSNREVLLTL